MNDLTFLVTYFAQPDLLKVNRDSLDKHHPNALKIISQQADYEPNDLGRWDKMLRHNMRAHTWSQVCKNLITACDTEIGVFIEHDAFLLRPLDELLDLVRSGEHDLIGPEEEIPRLRHSPGMVCQSFFIVNVGKFKREYDLEHVDVRDIERRKDAGYQIESAHGISQTFDKKKFLPVKYSGYAHGTLYGDYVHHLWYGSYPKRDLTIDNIDKEWMGTEAERLTDDYWNNNLQFK